MDEKATDLQRALLRVLRAHRGADNPVTSTQLLLLVQRRIANRSVDNRTMRSAIQELRLSGDIEGARICSTTKKGGGYYLATDDKELEQYLDQIHGRALVQLKMESTQRKCAGLEPRKQEMLFDA